MIHRTLLAFLTAAQLSREAEAIFTRVSLERNVSVPFGVQPTKFFSPLACNENAFQVPNDCELWSAKNPDLSSTVLIPCGTCWILDIKDGRTLNLKAGLDIQGHLEVPPDAAFTMITPVVLVQGSFTYEPTEQYVSPENQKVKFRFVGNEVLTFIPHVQNAGVCGSPTCSTPNACEIGKKSFVMAGGKITVNAWPNKQCPTWVMLHDTTEKPLPSPDMTPYSPFPQPEEANCNTRVLVNENFSGSIAGGPPPAGWTASNGTQIEVGYLDGTGPGTGHFIKSIQRKKDSQGPLFTINKSIVECMPPDTEYLVSVKAKLTSTLDRPSYCSSGDLEGKHCLKVAFQSMDEKGELGFKLLLRQTKEQGMATPDGSWFTLSGTVKLSSSEIFPTNGVYHLLQFAGPEPGIDISINEVVLKLPSVESYPASAQAMCADLAAPNGNAELDPVFSFPVQDDLAIGSVLTVENEIDEGNSTNQFFRSRYRTRHWASPVVQLPMDCIEQSAVYDFSAKIRIHTPVNTTATAQLMLKTYNADEFANPSYVISAIVTNLDCEDQSFEDGWVTCRSKMMFNKEHAAARRIDFFVATRGSTYDLDLDDIEIKQVRRPLDALVLDDSIEPCWGVGSEIVLTSNTFNMSDYSLGTIKNVTRDEHTPAGKVLVYLEEPLQNSHTTEIRGGVAASEVALLSRNLVFEAEKDDVSNPYHGGHTKVMHTPNVVQTMEGIELINFGQQGNKGRYPLHMHMSGESPGTSISYNTVRQSNQRCIVVHESHNVTVSHNVMFDTFGHCLMLEDGGERGNVINYNLGTMTKNTPDEGVLGITESDMFAATLWASSVEDNEFVGNVLAGSEDSGVWVEMLEHVRGPSEYLYEYKNPSRQLFKKFRGNRSHSNMRSGVRLYPNGHFPDQEAIYEDQTSYRNNADGFLFHNSRFLTIKGGHFLDNRMGVQLDKGSDRMNVTGAYIEGLSDLFKEEVEIRKTIMSHCPGFRPLTGIQLHSFLRFKDSQGYFISNITFRNFNENSTKCWNSAAFDLDSQIRDGHYDATAHIANVTFHEGATQKEKLNMCDLATELNQDVKYISDFGFLHDMYLEDMTGEFDPKGLHRKGSVISNHTKMTTFCPEHEPMEGSCAVFCPGKCYRTINYGIPADPVYKEVYMRVVDTETGLSADFQSYITNYTKVKADGTCCEENVERNSGYTNRRYISPALPKGFYNVTFMKDGVPIWPDFAEENWGYEPADCGENFLQEGQVMLIVPPLDGGSCDNLVRNGDASDGSRYWVAVGGDRAVVSNGVGGSVDPALASINREFNADGLGQYLNSRCLTTGSEYEVTAKVKLLGKDASNNTVIVKCNPNEFQYLAYYACPRFAFRMRFNTMMQAQGTLINDSNTMYMYPVGEVLNPTANGWNTMHGTFTVPPEMEAATSVMLFLERTRPGVDVHLDDVVIRPISRGCELISNGDVESGDTRFWKPFGVSQITAIKVPDGSGITNHVIWVYDRNSTWASAAQEIKPGCLKAGDSYKVSAKIALAKNGTGWVCDPTSTVVESRCPTIIIQAQTGNETFGLEVATLIGSWKSGEFHEFYGEFEVTQFLETAEIIKILPSGVRSDVDIYIDNLKMEPTATWDCAANGLLKNPGGELGDQRFWSSWRGGSVNFVSGGGFNGTHALVGESREIFPSGISQAIERKCLERGVLYSVSVWVKLLDAQGNPWNCNPRSTKITDRCPVVSVGAENPGVIPFMHAIGGVDSQWVPNDWNELTGVFHFFPTDLVADTTSIVVSEAPAGVTILVDNADIRIIRRGL